MVHPLIDRRGVAGVVLAVVLLGAGAAESVGAAPSVGTAKAVAKQHRGPYAVGMRSYTFVDTRRPTAANGSYPGGPTRTLPTLLLYPAQGDPSGPAVENAKPFRARNGHRFPLVVFSHGFGSTGPAYAPLLEQFVREGYVVAALTFPLSSGGAPGGQTIGDYVNQPADVSFVLTRVLRLGRGNGLMRKTIDRRDVGVAGHSLGAMTTLGLATNSCCGDARVDAAVSISGLELPFPGGSFFSEPTPPLLVVHGDADATIPYGGSVAPYAQAPAPKVFLTLEHGSHVPFLAPWLEPFIRTTTDFLDGFLKHDRKALHRLAADGNVAGVTTLQAELTRRGP